MLTLCFAVGTVLIFSIFWPITCSIDHNSFFFYSNLVHFDSFTCQLQHLRQQVLLVSSHLHQDPNLHCSLVFSSCHHNRGKAHFPHVAALPQQVPSSQKVTPSPPRQEAAAVPVQISPGPSITPPSQTTIQHGTPAPSQRPVTSSVSPEELRPQGLQMYYTPGQHTPTDSQAPPISYRTPGLSPPQYTVPPSTPVAPSRLPEPIVPHWFYFKEGRKWTPFSHIDSESLELASKTPSSGESRIVPTDGGRYDVDLDKRLRHAIYWEESVSVVRRCSWFL